MTLDEKDVPQNGDPVYQLGAKLARGGMAEVYLAKKRLNAQNPDYICVVKRILPHYAEEREYIEMFRGEAHLCMQLVHENIIRVYDFNKIRNSYAMIMEYVDGFDLRTFLAELEKNSTQLTIPMAVSIVMQAARGLHYAHTLKNPSNGKKLDIVHRDISPQNLMIDVSGRIKVIDFGIAKFEKIVQETKPGVVKGKYSYMSPEQARGENIDARSDVFSLCIVLWEALSMKRLFADDVEVKTIRKVSQCIIEHDLRILNEHVDQALFDIVMQGLSSNPKKRIQSAAELAIRLEKYLLLVHPSYSHDVLGNHLVQTFGDKLEKRKQQVSELVSSEQQFHTAAYTSLALIPRPSTMPHPSGSNVTLSPFKRTTLSDGLDWFYKWIMKPDAKPRPQSKQGTRTNQNSVHRTNSSVSAASLSPLISLKRKQKFVLGAWVLVAAMLVYFVAQRLEKGDSFPLRIDSSPKKVILTVNGRVQNDGRYFQSPIRLKLPTGRHEIKLFHHNFKEKKWTVTQNDSKPLSLSNLRLNPLPKNWLAPIRFLVKGTSKKIVVDLNDGLYLARTPFNYTAGLNTKSFHSLKVYPDYPKRTGTFRCNFKPQKLKKNTLVIDTKTERCFTRK